MCFGGPGPEKCPYCRKRLQLRPETGISPQSRSGLKHTHFREKAEKVPKRFIIFFKKLLGNITFATLLAIGPKRPKFGEIAQI